LTILISNMGDTVIKEVNDFTIWIGEITVLPSENSGVMDRLKLGLYKATLGLIPLDLSTDGAEADQDDEAVRDIERFQELNPGLFKMYRQRDDARKRYRREGDPEADCRLGKDFKQSVMEEAAEEKAGGDNIARDDHYYRHLLVSHIRKVWNNLKAMPAKKYSYVEWVFYLSLLGEDEIHNWYHRQAHANGVLHRLKAKERSDERQKEGENQERQNSANSGNELAQQNDANIIKWSWMGPRSPLMGAESESEWLLNKLFARLQDNLEQDWEDHQREAEARNMT
jgi:potassium channel subfamily K